MKEVNISIHDYEKLGNSENEFVNLHNCIDEFNSPQRTEIEFAILGVLNNIVTRTNILIAKRCELKGNGISLNSGNLMKSLTDAVVEEGAALTLIYEHLTGLCDSENKGTAH